MTLGLPGGGAIEYAPRAAGSAAEIRAGLEERRDADLRLGRTSWGPHLDELKIAAGGPSPCAATVRRVSSGRRSSRCFSPSARRC